MSLIGPRTICDWEKHLHSGYEDLYTQVVPGITGLWQVTDRYDSTFEERQFADVYYMRNWSIFLDLYIIGRTFGVMLSGKGV
jgi:lipopolysaccharide/colanic/teichoic acid biosynthesis glycosyltransferase